MNEILKKIKALGFGEYAVCKKDGQIYLLLFMGYNYYKEKSEENFMVSPYYFASNRAYFASGELAEYICSLGYSARMKNHIVYDELLESCGAVRGDNNLFFIEGMGSLFCVHVIETDAPLNEKTIKGKECTHCGRCITACPTGALTGEGLTAGDCLRDRMTDIADEGCRDKITTLLGCDLCQKVCPNNSRETAEKTCPQLGKEKLLAGDLSGLPELIGKNMARRRRLQFQAMCITANTGDTQRIKAVETISEKSLENTKKWCLDRLKAVD